MTPLVLLHLVRFGIQLKLFQRLQGHISPRCWASKSINECPFRVFSNGGLPIVLPNHFQSGKTDIMARTYEQKTYKFPWYYHSTHSIFVHFLPWFESQPLGGLQWFPRAMALSKQLEPGAFLLGVGTMEQLDRFSRSFSVGKVLLPMIQYLILKHQKPPLEHNNL